MSKDSFSSKVYPIVDTWLTASTFSITISNRDLTQIQSYLKGGFLRIDGVRFLRSAGLVSRIDLKLSGEFICPPLFFDNVNGGQLFFPAGYLIHQFPDQIDLTGTAEASNSTINLWFSVRR